MIVDDLLWTPGGGWRKPCGSATAGLVLYFGARAAIEDGRRFAELRDLHPGARLLGCSTGGQIRAGDVEDHCVTGVAITLERSNARFHSTTIESAADSRRCGQDIGRALAGEGLRGVFLLSDGLAVNGSELVAGLADAVGLDVPITGGLAGDGARFISTLVGADAAPRSHAIAAIGFYGAAIRMGHGSAGGWSVFGPRRTMTRSHDNVLYELSDKKALDLYELYLGPEDAKELPGSALLYPLLISDPENPQQQVVRTVLGVDRLQRSMTFAGSMPQGWSAQLMRGSFDRLIAGASAAAEQARLPDDAGEPDLAIMISCIGRRLLMGQSVVGEVEAAAAALGSNCHKLGFYSYGEISPHHVTGRSILHNQTMTVMTLSEARGP
jgi:hypothetical protein